MHVGLNLVYLVPRQTGGMEVFARELLPELVAAAPEHHFTAFINREAAESPGPWHDLMDSVVVPVRAQRRIEWVRGEQQLLPGLAQRARVDLLHSLASTAPVWGRFRRVVTIHDLTYRTLPDAHPGLRSLGMRVLVPLAARRSTRVIAISQATRDDIVRHLRVPTDRIDLVPQGHGELPTVAPTGEAELRQRLQASDRTIVLSLSAKLPHKNLMRLLGAMAVIPVDRRPLLILPGYATGHEAELRARTATLGLDDDVRFLGWISAEDLEGLYAIARCFVFPSLAEGFGAPILEAMARGVPIACSQIPVLAEVAGDAALLFDPRSEAAIARAIERLLGDEALTGRLVQRGRERATRFTFDKTAAGTLRSYARALGASGSPDAWAQ